MKRMEPARIREVAEFISRFGFITREIYFKYFCKQQRTQKYESWNYLLADRWIVPHDCRKLSGYLSPKAKSYFAPYSVPASSTQYIEHDSFAAEFLLELNRLGLVRQYWTESEMSSVPAEVYGILGSKSADKIPDLVVDLEAQYGSLRIALEVELNRKSKERYDHAALSYLAMRNIDLVVYGCRHEKTAIQVLNSFRGELFVKEHQLPAVFSIEHFAKDGIEAQVKFQGREFKISEFLEKALRKNVQIGNEPFSTDLNRTAVRPRPVAERKSA